MDLLQLFYKTAAQLQSLCTFFTYGVRVRKWERVQWCAAGLGKCAAGAKGSAEDDTSQSKTWRCKADGGVKHGGRKQMVV